MIEIIVANVTQIHENSEIISINFNKFYDFINELIFRLYFDNPAPRTNSFTNFFFLKLYIILFLILYPLIFLYF